MSAKRGRPRLYDQARTIAYKLRLKPEEYKQLQFVASKQKKSMAEVLRKGIKMQYDLTIYCD